MARRPKNPINDIINVTSAWLGGSRGAAVPSQTNRAMVASKQVAGIVDAATGGFGRAVVKDAQSGSNTPSALYKTAAVNLAAAAAGAGAARVAGKAVSKVSNELIPAVNAARNAARGDLAAQRGLLHGTSQKFKPGDIVLPASRSGQKTIWEASNPKLAYATSNQEFAKRSAFWTRHKNITENKGLVSGLLNPRIQGGVPVRQSIGELSTKQYNRLVKENRVRIYEVEPANPSDVRINKIDKIREKQSESGFVVKREIYKGPVFDKTFPKGVKKYRGNGKNKK